MAKFLYSGPHPVSLPASLGEGQGEGVIGLLLSVFADNLNFKTMADCDNAFNHYVQLAQADAASASSPQAAAGFYNMARFFQQAASYNETKEDCAGGTCYFTISARCTMLNYPAQVPMANMWQTLVAPALSKEVDILNSGNYDASITSRSSFSVTCGPFPKDAPNYSSCVLIRS